MYRFLDVIAPTRAQKTIGVVGLIIFQSDYAASLDTVFLIPCRDMAANLDLGKVTPSFELNGQIVFAMVPQMAGVRRVDLGATVIGNALTIRDDLVHALDLLVTGF